MNLEPQKQRYLYELDHYLIEFIELYKNNKLPNKLLLSGDKGIGKSTLAYHLVNFILSQNEKFPYDTKKFEINKNNKSFKLTINGSIPNLILILIKPEQTLSIMDFELNQRQHARPQALPLFDTIAMPFRLKNTPLCVQLLPM